MEPLQFYGRQSFAEGGRRLIAASEMGNRFVSAGFTWYCLRAFGSAAAIDRRPDSVGCGGLCWPDDLAVIYNEPAAPRMTRATYFDNFPLNDLGCRFSDETAAPVLRKAVRDISGSVHVMSSLTCSSQQTVLTKV